MIYPIFSGDLLKMCTNTISSDYALMFKFYYSFKGEIQCPVHLDHLHFAQNAPEGTVLDPVLEYSSLA